MIVGYISVSSVTAAYGSALTAAHFWKGPKVSKRPSPHHSAPRLGSVFPHSGLNPWAAVMGHPWPRTANPASCRVTHEFKPAFGQRGLTGRLRSRSKADQERLASHRSYRWLRRTAQLCRYLCCDDDVSVTASITARPLSQASQLPHLIFVALGIAFA